MSIGICHLFSWVCGCFIINVFVVSVPHKCCTLPQRANVCNIFDPFADSFFTLMAVVPKLSNYMESHVCSPG